MYRTILITGGAGFIGSHVVDAFAKALLEGVIVAHRIVVIDTLDYCASLKNLELSMSLGNVVFVNVNVCDAIRLKSLFVEYDIDAIVHLAAQSHVDRSFGNSLIFTEVNVRGTHTLLEVARNQWTADKDHSHLFLHMSTDEVYGSCSASKHDETSSMLQPTNPYAASKAAAEMYVRAYHTSFGLPVVIVRSNNVYGPRQYPEKVIPKFILRLQSGQLPTLQGSGNQKRSFLFANDAANALLSVFLKGRIGAVYNCGSDDEFTIRELAHILIQKMHPQSVAHELSHEQDRPFNDQRYYLSTESIRNELNWEPKVSFDDGLVRTITWYNSINTEQYWIQPPPS